MRGDESQATIRAIVSGFNPRPTLSCGATRAAGVYAVTLQSFQSAPHTFMRGDYRWTDEQRKQYAFQSAPHTFMRGDNVSFSALARAAQFQSAPHTFMRGDHNSMVAGSNPASFNPRPTLSCGATDRFLIEAAPIGVSIRAPHFHAGRRVSDAGANRG